MEFRRINGLPPYVFAAINQLRDEARRAGEDVIDLGFGNPDIPSPPVAVEKLAEAARNPRNHRYSSSRGLPNLRLAVSNLYRRRFDVELDPETEVVFTIGAKEGLSHLMWVLLARRLGPGAFAVLPDPHLRAPVRWSGSTPGAPGPRSGFLRQPGISVGRGVAAAESDRFLIPSQPDDGVRRPRLDATDR